MTAPRVPRWEVASRWVLRPAAAVHDATALAPALPALRRKYADATAAALRAYGTAREEVLGAEFGREQRATEAVPPAVEGAEAQALADPFNVTDWHGGGVTAETLAFVEHFVESMHPEVVAAMAATAKAVAAKKKAVATRDRVAANIAGNKQVKVTDVDDNKQTKATAKISIETASNLSMAGVTCRRFTVPSVIARTGADACKQTLSKMKLTKDGGAVIHDRAWWQSEKPGCQFMVQVIVNPNVVNVATAERHFGESVFDVMVEDAEVDVILAAVAGQSDDLDALAEADAAAAAAAAAAAGAGEKTPANTMVVKERLRKVTETRAEAERLRKAAEALADDIAALTADTTAAARTRAAANVAEKRARARRKQGERMREAAVVLAEAEFDLQALRKVEFDLQAVYVYPREGDAVTAERHAEGKP